MKELRCFSNLGFEKGTDGSNAGKRRSDASFIIHCS
jgi:hypothetical protein